MTSAFGVDHGISKSLVGGVFKPASKLKAKEIKAVRRGGAYKKAKGPTKADTEFKQNSTRATQMFRQNKEVFREPGYKGIEAPTYKEKKVRGQRNPVSTYKTSVFDDKTLPAGVGGFTVRTGSKSHGTSHVVYRGMSSIGSSRKPKTTLKHEMAHARPKRSAYRMEQIGRNPAKQMREEARADFEASGHYKKVNPKKASGYEQLAQLRAAGKKQKKKPLIGRFLAKPAKNQQKYATKEMARRSQGQYKISGKNVNQYIKTQDKMARARKKK